MYKTHKKYKILDNYRKLRLEIKNQAIMHYNITENHPDFPDTCRDSNPENSSKGASDMLRYSITRHHKISDENPPTIPHFPFSISTHNSLLPTSTYISLKYK